jgi:dTDP-glucose 4,6-dehydratase
MKILVTGGAGFIGSALIRHLLAGGKDSIVNVDRLTYAASPEAVADAAAAAPGRYHFVQADVADGAAIAAVLREHQPDAVMHLAAESHVDRSLDDAGEFVRTNITGTWTLLDAALHYWLDLPAPRRAAFRFHQVSTDEVYGDIDAEAAPADEAAAYRPSSPYAASKAAADHLVRAWHRSYGLPVVVSNSANNYGPWQQPEKLIPLMILNARAGLPLPVYGDGKQCRDWLHVEDHARALELVIKQGTVGTTYNVGTGSETCNMAVVESLCDILAELAAEKPAGISHYRELIRHVADRPGHDRRYALDATRIRRELGWAPRISLRDGLVNTVRWYLDHPGWCTRVRSGYARLGLARRPEGSA